MILFGAFADTYCIRCSVMSISLQSAWQHMLVGTWNTQMGNGGEGVLRRTAMWWTGHSSAFHTALRETYSSSPNKGLSWPDYKALVTLHKVTLNGSQITTIWTVSLAMWKLMITLHWLNTLIRVALLIQYSFSNTRMEKTFFSEVRVIISCSSLSC